MPAPLFSPAQNDRLEALYLTEGRAPAEIVSILMAENPGLVVTARQVSERISTRNLGKKRREIIAKAELKVAQKIAGTATSLINQRTAVAENHKDFLEASVRIGSKAMVKAEEILSTSGSARDISSAVNAAAKAIDIYRRAVGLDPSPGGPASNCITNFFFDFARAPGSPFHRPVPAPVEPAAAAPADVGKPTDTETVTQSEETLGQSTKT